MINGNFFLQTEPECLVDNCSFMFPHFFYIFQVMIIDSFEFSDRICNSFFARTRLHPSFFYGVRVAHLFNWFVVLLCVLTFVLCVRSNFRMNTMFGSSLPPVACWRAHVLFMLFVFVCVQHILCWFFCGFFVFVLCPILISRLRLVYIFDCPSSSCVHFWLSLRYSLTLIIYNVQ